MPQSLPICIFLSIVFSLCLSVSVSLPPSPSSCCPVVFTLKICKLVCQGTECLWWFEATEEESLVVAAPKRKPRQESLAAGLFFGLGPGCFQKWTASKLSAKTETAGAPVIKCAIRNLQTPKSGKNSLHIKPKRDYSRSIPQA